MPIVSGVGAPGTVGPASGGKVYGYNTISTTPNPVAPAASSRRQITFHNPGAVDVFVCPQYLLNSGSSVPVTPSPSNLAGCFLIFANGGTLILTGECQGQWQAFSRSGSGNYLTVMDSFI